MRNTIRALFVFILILTMSLNGMDWPMNIAEASHTTGCVINTFTCKGDAQIAIQTGISRWTGCLRTAVIACTSATDSTDRTIWEMDAGSSVSLIWRFENDVGSLVPDTVIIQIRFDDTATVIRELHNGAVPAQDTTFTFFATNDGTVSGSPTAGTYRMYLRIIRGGITAYDFNTDNDLDNTNCIVGSTCFTAQGVLRGKMIVSNIQSSTPTGGIIFTYGTSGDESVTITVTHTQPNGDLNTENAFTRIYRDDGSTIIQSGSITDLDTTTFVQSYIIDLTFQEGQFFYDTAFLLTGNAVLTGFSWTIFATTGHGTNVIRDSDTQVRNDDAFQANPRIIFHDTPGGTFATANNDVTSNHEVYNRGETATLSWRLLNARSEELTRLMTFTLRDTSNTQCDTFTDTGPAYGETRTISTTLCLAANTVTGTQWHVRATNTDQLKDSDNSFAVSTLYFVDSHPENDNALTEDDFPNQDANEDLSYIIGADLLFAWCQVEGVRLDDTQIDTTGSAVTFTMFNPFGGIEGTATRDTGIDGWTTTFFGFTPIPPAGIWTLRCEVAFNGNSGVDDEQIDFISSFTGNLVPRFWTNTTLHANQEYKIVIVAEVEDAPTEPDVVPRVNIVQVDTTQTVPIFTTIIDNQPAPNVVNWMNTVNGFTYQVNWTPPENGTYNIRVRVTLASAGVRAQQSVEVTPIIISGNQTIGNETMLAEFDSQVSTSLDGFFWLMLFLVIIFVHKTVKGNYGTGFLMLLSAMLFAYSFTAFDDVQVRILAALASLIAIVFCVARFWMKEGKDSVKKDAR